MNLNKPINEDRSHFFIDVILVFHVSWASGSASLDVSEMNVHRFNVFCRTQGIIGITSVDIVDRTRMLVATTRTSLTAIGLKISINASA